MNDRVIIVSLEKIFFDLINGNKFQNVKKIVLFFFDENSGQNCNYLELGKSRGICSAYSSYKLKNSLLLTTQYQTNHYHKLANSHELNEQCGKIIMQYTLHQTDVSVLWGKYMPHEHTFMTETSYLKHLLWINNYKLHISKLKMKRADNGLVQMAP
jgi:hypothetical protein